MQWYTNTHLHICCSSRNCTSKLIHSPHTHPSTCSLVSRFTSSSYPGSLPLRNQAHFLLVPRLTSSSYPGSLLPHTQALAGSEPGYEATVEMSQRIASEVTKLSVLILTLSCVSGTLNCPARAWPSWLGPSAWNRSGRQWLHRRQL